MRRRKKKKLSLSQRVELQQQLVGAAANKARLAAAQAQEAGSPPALKTSVSLVSQPGNILSGTAMTAMAGPPDRPPDALTTDKGGKWQTSNSLPSEDPFGGRFQIPCARALLCEEEVHDEEEDNSMAA